ncbi:Uncharacterised protein [uncultured archaeon]|nr:Uncharacterised protein [uncultured archaeon]
MLTYSSWFIGEIAASAFMLASLYFLQKTDRKSLYLTGLLAGLAFLTKTQMIPLLIFLVIYLYWYKIEKRYFTLGLLSIAIPYFILKTHYLGIESFYNDYNFLMTFVNGSGSGYNHRTVHAYLHNGGRLVLDNSGIILIGLLYFKKVKIYKHLVILCGFFILFFLFAPYGDRYGLAIIPLIIIILSASYDPIT